MKIRILLSTIALAILGFVGWNLYGYFFFNAAPELSISGINNNGYYRGNIPCLVKGFDDYKVSKLSIQMNNKPLISNSKINKKSFEYKFDIPTNTLNDGAHSLYIEIENGTYVQKKSNKKIDFHVDNVSLHADFVNKKEEVKVYQGKVLRVLFQSNKPLENTVVNAGINTYSCFPEQESSLIYECYIPIDCEESPGEYPLSINLKDKVGNNLVLKDKYRVLSFPFKKQKINIKNDKIEQENKLGKTEKELEKVLKKIAEDSPKRKLWHGHFVAPTEIQRVTTEFGVTRVTPERGLRQHKALDIYNTPKAPVWSSQDGIVVLKDRFAHSGKTIGVDHGYGLISLYYHLEDFADIEVGESIKKGYKVGTLGMTGYATGYHLHWEMRLNNIAVDPMQWIKSDF